VYRCCDRFLPSSCIRRQRKRPTATACKSSYWDTSDLVPSCWWMYFLCSRCVCPYGRQARSSPCPHLQEVVKVSDAIATLRYPEQASRTNRYSQFHGEFHARPARVFARSLLHQLESSVPVVDDDNGLAHYCDGTYGAILLFVLQPVLVFQGSWRRKIVDISEKWNTFWAGWKWQFVR